MSLALSPNSRRRAEQADRVARAREAYSRKTRVTTGRSPPRSGATGATGIRRSPPRAGATGIRRSPPRAGATGIRRSPPRSGATSLDSEEEV